MKSELLWDAMGHIDESRIEEALCQPEDRPAGKKRKKIRLKKRDRVRSRGCACHHGGDSPAGRGKSGFLPGPLFGFSFCGTVLYSGQGGMC